MIQFSYPKAKPQNLVLNIYLISYNLHCHTAQLQKRANSKKVQVNAEDVLSNSIVTPRNHDPRSSSQKAITQVSKFLIIGDLGNLTWRIQQFAKPRNIGMGGSK